MTIDHFKAGPLPKKDSTKLLESLIHNLLSPDYKSTFSMEKGELILEQKPNNGGDAIKHNISLLLQFGNFSHIGIFEKKECELYMEKMKSILGNDPDYVDAFEEKEEKKASESTDFDMDFPNLESESKTNMPASKFEITQAHKFAINYYTQTLNINPFLRGEFFKLNTQNPVEFQKECFLLLTSSAFVQDFLRNQESILTPGEGDSDPSHQHIKMIRALRIEPFKGEPPLYESLRKLKQVASQSATIHTRGFTSYSGINLALADPNHALDHLSEENKLPVFHAKDDIHIVIHESELHEKFLGEYSAYQQEKEILTEQSAKEIKVVNKMGNILFVKTTQARPVDVDPEDKYFLELAIRYIYEKILQYPYPEPFANGPDCQVTLTREIKSNDATFGNSETVTIVRNNHGLAHAARQASHIEDLLKTFSEQLTEKYKPYIEEIIENPDIKHLVQIAAAFLTVGRVNEARGGVNVEEDKQVRINCRKAFDKFVSTYYPSQPSNKLTDIIPMLSNAVEHSVTGKLEEAKTDKEKVFFCLLNAAHLLEVPRVPDLWLKSKKDDQNKDIELGKWIFKTLFSYPIFTGSATYEQLEPLWKVSLERIVKTGDRIPDIDRNYVGYDFIDCSQNPAHVSEVLELSNPLPFLIREHKEDLTDKKIYIDALVYILTHSVDPDAQLEIFKTEPEFSDLIYFAGEYLQQHAEVEVETDKEVIAKIKAAFDSTEFQLARAKIVSNPLPPISFGDESLDKLPRLLKYAARILKEANLASQENIKKLQAIYMQHPDSINDLVESIRYMNVNKPNELNADTFQLLCLQTDADPDMIVELLRYYLNPNSIFGSDLNPNSSTHYQVDTNANNYTQLAEIFLNHENQRSIILFTLFAGTGKLDSLKKLVDNVQDTEKIKSLISSHNFFALHFANHDKVIEYLFSIAPTLSFKQLMIKQFNFFSRPNLVNTFESPDMLKCFCDAADFDQKQNMFIAASSAGRLNIVQTLLTDLVLNNNTPKEIFENAFQSAAERGHKNVIEYMLRMMPEKSKDLLACDSFLVIARMNPNDLTKRDFNNFLLEKTRVDYAEDLTDLNNYNKMSRYIDMEIRFLQKHIEDFKRDHPNEVFPLSPDEIKRYFYMLCHLVNAKNLPYFSQLYLHALLAVPSIKKQVFTVIANSDANAVNEFSLSVEMINKFKNHPDIKKLLAQENKSQFVTYHVGSAPESTSNPNKQAAVEQPSSTHVAKKSKD